MVNQPNSTAAGDYGPDVILHERAPREDAGSQVTLADVQSAANLLATVSEITPVQPSRLLSELVGRPVWLKLENLQRAGSFKIRGAFNRMSRLSEAEKAKGVVAASAGNHAQGVALAAQMLGMKATIYMPVDAPLPKIEATRGYGAEIKLVGKSVDEALTYALAESEQTGATLIHPFDHPDIVAGQGTIALEILAQVPEVDTIIVPVGGGGLIAGIATVLAEVAPHVKVIGVQAKNAAAYPDSLAAQKPIPHKLGQTMADGIAVGTPGKVPLNILTHLGVEVETVSESDLARALLALIERSKIVVEPSGAAGVAALMANPKQFAAPAATQGGDDGAKPTQSVPGSPATISGRGAIVPVLSGGNIDPQLLMRLIRRGLVEGGRLLQLRVHVDDRPGSLARLLTVAAEAGANVVDVRHSRMESNLGIFEAVVLLELEAKGPAHCEQVRTAISDAGFRIV